MQTINIQLNRQDGTIARLMQSKHKETFLEWMSYIIQLNDVSIVHTDTYNNVTYEQEPKIFANSFEESLINTRLFTRFFDEGRLNVKPINFIQDGDKYCLQCITSDNRVLNLLKQNPVLHVRVTLPYELEDWIYSDELDSSPKEHAQGFLFHFIPLLFIIEEKKS